VKGPFATLPKSARAQGHTATPDCAQVRGGLRRIRSSSAGMSPCRLQRLVGVARSCANSAHDIGPLHEAGATGRCFADGLPQEEVQVHLRAGMYLSGPSNFYDLLRPLYCMPSLTNGEEDGQARVELYARVEEVGPTQGRSGPDDGRRRRREPSDRSRRCRIFQNEPN
jgi:hypothetical protein